MGLHLAAGRRLRGLDPDSPTARSSIEQKLLVQALERAFEGLNSQLVKGKTVAVEFYGLTPDKDFARELFIAHLQSEGAIIPPITSQAQLRLKAFAPVLAVDRGQSFIGAPSFTVPLVGFVVPQIPLFRDVKHSGHAEIKVFASDAETENLSAKASSPSANPITTISHC